MTLVLMDSHLPSACGLFHVPSSPLQAQLHFREFPELCTLLSFWGLFFSPVASGGWVKRRKSTESILLAFSLPKGLGIAQLAECLTSMQEMTLIPSTAWSRPGGRSLKSQCWWGGAWGQGKLCLLGSYRAGSAIAKALVLAEDLGLVIHNCL